MKDIWRHSGDELIRAQDDAVQLTVRDLERAGIDILTDGEVRRESYFNEFVNIAEDTVVTLQKESSRKSNIQVFIDAANTLDQIKTFFKVIS